MRSESRVCVCYYLILLCNYKPIMQPIQVLLIYIIEVVRSAVYQTRVYYLVL